MLALELREASSDLAARAVADGEAHEDAPAGIRIALFSGSGFVGGDRRVISASAITRCRTESSGADSVRACGQQLGTMHAIAQSSLRPLHAYRRLFAGAALVAIALAAAIAALSSRRIAAWVVRPLTRLRDDIETVQASAPDPSAIRGADEYEEVGAVRNALTNLLARLATALAQSRRFATDAAHELRTPLTTMFAELELLAEDLALDSPSRATLARVRRTLGGLAARVESLLIMALPGERSAWSREAIALGESVDEAVASLPAEQRARVIVHRDDEGMVRGDAALLRALIDNGLDNALKFAASGPVIVRIGLDGERVVLEVQDEGPGVPADERANVFLPFYRTASARSGTAHGYGLGLALIAHIATTHGGTAQFDDVALGTRLRITLPAWSASR